MPTAATASHRLARRSNPSERRFAISTNPERALLPALPITFMALAAAMAMESSTPSINFNN